MAVVVTNSKGPTSKSSLFEDVTTQKESIEDNNSLVLSEENSSMTSFELSLFYFKVFACLEGRRNFLLASLTILTIICVVLMT